MRAGVPDFPGLKITQDTAASVAFPEIRKINVALHHDKIVTETPGAISAGSSTGGGNSGFQALNLAAQFGARKIVLVGFDMRLDEGIHWHGRHPRGMNNPREANFTAWRRALNASARDLAALGIEVVNASPVSTLTAFPFADLSEAVSC